MTNQKIKSHNSEQFNLVKDLFLPSPLHLVLYLLTGTVILAAINTTRFWNYLSHNPVGRTRSLELFGSGNGSDGILGGSTSGRVSQMLVWGLVGITIYVVIWFLKNIIINLRNDVVADEYVHPHSYDRTKYWKSVIARKVLFIFIVGVFTGYLYLLTQLTPILQGYFFQMVTQINGTTLSYGMASVASAALLLHVSISLFRLTISAWRFIYADL